MYQIEVILGAKDAPAPPAPKTLSDRIAKPKPAGKNKPKPVTADKAAPAKGEKKPRGGRGRNAGRPKVKNADELDAEMQDYFATGVAGGDTAVPNGGAVQPTNGDAGMEDDGELTPTLKIFRTTEHTRPHSKQSNIFMCYPELFEPLSMRLLTFVQSSPKVNSICPDLYLGRFSLLQEYQALVVRGLRGCKSTCLYFRGFHWSDTPLFH